MSQSIRERLRENRRNRRNERLRFLLSVGLVLACGAYGWWYTHSPDFAYGSVAIGGTNKINEDDILRMVGAKAPFNFFLVSAKEVEEALRHDSRFRKAEARYRWPGAVLQIYVEEREPALYVANAYRSYLELDYDGFVLEVTRGLPDARAPLLNGASCGNVYLGDFVTNNVVLSILGFLKQLTPEARDEIAEITVDDKENVTLARRGSFPVRLGPAEGIVSKATAYLAIYEEFKDKYINAAYIDIGTSQYYVRFKPQKDETQTKTDATVKTQPQPKARA